LSGDANSESLSQAVGCCQADVAFAGEKTRDHDLDPQKATLVKLRFFAGLTNEVAAAAMGISTTTAQRMWAYSRAWLRTEVE